MNPHCCKVCRRDLTQQPNVFRKGWWYCWEHAPNVGAVARIRDEREIP